LIADDQDLIRTGFRMILESEGIEVVGEAVDGNEAVELTRGLRPDIVLMDIRMPRLDGLEATRIIAADESTRNVRVLILTTFDLDEYVYEALRAGAGGFLLKDSPREQLLYAIEVVARGDSLLDPQVTRRFIDEFARRPLGTMASRKVLDQLTPRELEVLGLVARGLSNGEIAAELFVGEATVKTHVTHILTKLGLRDRVQAVILAYENGIVAPGSDS
jgi:DNA-binding NarL/FixJ family response regulator